MCIGFDYLMVLVFGTFPGTTVENVNYLRGSKFIHYMEFLMEPLNPTSGTSVEFMAIISNQIYFRYALFFCVGFVSYRIVIFM